MTPHWLRILAIDLGFDDSDAFSVLAFHRYDPAIYIDLSFKRAGTDVTATCTMAKQLWDKASPIKTVIDTGGLGKKIAKEITSRHSIPLHAAEKTDKDANVRLLKADLKAGRVKLVAPRCGDLIKELKEGERDPKTGKMRESCEDDCIDSVLYGVRAARHYRAEHWEEPPEVGSPEWEAEQARLDRERDLEAARERYEAQQSGRLVDMVRSLQ
jgi:hypothetical protein